LLSSNVAAGTIVKVELFSHFVAQSSLSITNIVNRGIAGTPILLTTSGGSGDIAPTFTVTGSGCSVSGSLLKASEAGNCFVRATNPANGIYAATTSAAMRFTFLLAQATLTISNTKTAGTAGTAIVVTTKGGSGVGQLRYQVSGRNCTIRASSLTASGVAQCDVTVTKAGSGVYAATSSVSVRFSLGLASQLALAISNSVTSATLGSSIVLVTSGGSGRGSVSYAVTGSGCSLSGIHLTMSKIGSCSVTATKAASGIYASISSPPKLFTFTRKK
jgi:hypothetical protein